MSGLVERIGGIAEEAGWQITDRVDLPARGARRAAIPSILDEKLRDALRAEAADGLYSHQASALGLVAQGHDVCLATATASGKSLAFMGSAVQVLLRSPVARVLAVYPAKALIQDQYDKWQRMLGRFGLGCSIIDGSVPVNMREAQLGQNRVALMTPDVVHAWLLARSTEPTVARFLRGLRLLILDETHIYDGAFGTNMAYLTRRLDALTQDCRLICSTATVGAPSQTIQELTGRSVEVLGPDDDGSGSALKTVLRLYTMPKTMFDATIKLLVRLKEVADSRFLAFGDSRKAVERIAAATGRRRADGQADSESDDVDDDADPRGALGRADGPRILPYRAGYETEDRNAIQRALASGQLSGVISTSALELGLDIGDIDIGVLLNVPPSSKALWQRLGRAGRRREAVCLILDNGTCGDLQVRLDTPVEQNWLYLENRYIQYAHALCAAQELRARGLSTGDAKAFRTLPSAFLEAVENELNPTDIVPSDLYPLKQRGQGGPHLAFPLRSATEPNFQLSDARGTPLGTLSLSQALREAYPGAIHYYMAKPYRVYGFYTRSGEIKVKRAKHGTTSPIAQSMVFPRLSGGILAAWTCTDGAVAEVEVQVSERVLGFIEQHGSTKIESPYGPGSEYSQRELNRFFQTTGVLWCFGNRTGMTETVAEDILAAFCDTCGVQARDLGVGQFHVKQNPLLEDVHQGWCIYDSTNGSLRLTQRLAEQFMTVVDAAVQRARNRGDAVAEQDLVALADLADELRPLEATTPGAAVGPEPADWVVAIAPGSRGMYPTDNGFESVKVLGARYTPQGLFYDLEPRPTAPNARWSVAAAAVQPLHGQTEFVRYNVMTGEMEASEPQGPQASRPGDDSTTTESPAL